MKTAAGPIVRWIGQVGAATAVLAIVGVAAAPDRHAQHVELTAVVHV